MPNARITIRREREKPVLNQHPWVFSGAIQSIEGNPDPGDIVDVVSERGKFLARGYWNPKSQIQVRLLTWQDEEINEAWWRRMLERAINERDYLGARRLVNAENDFLPGLIVDRYGVWMVLQALTLGIDQRKQTIAAILMDIVSSKLNMRGVFERSDVDVRGKEGLKSVTGVLAGNEPPKLIQFEESDLQLQVDVRNGHKTGFYLDQRQNRSLLAELIDAKLPYQTTRVLNLFSYTGGFGINALSVESHQVINVDASHDALKLAESNFELNALYMNKVGHPIPDYTKHAEFIQADVFDLLHDYVDQKQRFDVIVCDPPKFAHNAQQVDKAARGYKDLNLNCFKLLNEGGYLMTFSCSGAISRDLFQKIVFGALADSGRRAQIVAHLSAADDHPIALTFPEGEYLKGLLLRVY